MIRFIRRDQVDNSAETLTLVRLDSDRSLAIQIETGTPDSWKRDPNARQFVGLYDLDGDQLQLGNETWEIATEQEFVGDDARVLDKVLELGSGWREDEDPSLGADEVAEVLRSAWETGSSICEAA